MQIKELIDKLASTNATSLLELLKEVERETWIKIGGGLAVAAVVWFVLIYPAWFKRPELLAKQKSIEAQMGQFKVLISKKAALDKQKQQTESLILDFQKKVFPEKDIQLLLGKISKLAKESEVEMMASRPIDKVDAFPAPYDKKYKRYVYQITVEGGYHKISSFVSRLESYPQFLQVQSLRIMPEPQQAGKQVADIMLMAVSHETAMSEEVPVARK